MKNIVTIATTVSRLSWKCTAKQTPGFNIKVSSSVTGHPLQELNISHRPQDRP